MSKLNHFNDQGQAHMVDVSNKETTSRVAVAKARILMNSNTLEIIKNGDAKKGDVLGIARTAGIMAAKKTADLIPLCHPLPITNVNINLRIEPSNTYHSQTNCPVLPPSFNVTLKSVIFIVLSIAFTIS